VSVTLHVVMPLVCYNEEDREGLVWMLGEVV
jgi:hypothetical protein